MECRITVTRWPTGQSNRERPVAVKGAVETIQASSASKPEGANQLAETLAASMKSNCQPACPFTADIAQSIELRLSTQRLAMPLTYLSPSHWPSKMKLILPADARIVYSVHFPMPTR